MEKISPPKGLSLIELLTTLVIVSTLAAMTLPFYKDLTSRKYIETERDQFASLIKTARHAAISFNQSVILCPGTSDLCLGPNHWHRGAVAFIDQNNNHQPDADEVLIATQNKLRSRVVWRAFRNRSYLRFEPSGFTAWQNGHFLLCPHNQNSNPNPGLARQMVLNAAGRLYFSKDKNSDGIHKDVQVRPLAY